MQVGYNVYSSLVYAIKALQQTWRYTLQKDIQLIYSIRLLQK